MRFDLCLALLFLLAATTPARAAVFVVDSSANTFDASDADGVCDDGTGACTLAAALQQANATAGTDRIEFAIPAPVPVSINVGSSLYASETVVIDATTQPGSTVNTAVTGTNAVLGILLTGVDVAFGVDAPNVEIRGLAIRPSRGLSTCLLFGPASTGSRLLGSSVTGCQGVGIEVQSSGVRIGEPALAARNLIGDNVVGILVTGQGNFVVNNLIGTDATGTARFGNAGSGIELSGDRNAVTDNTIAGNGFGVQIGGNDNTLVRNRIGGGANLENSQGVFVGGTANHIGLPSPTLAQANEIAGNVNGIHLGGSENFVQGNRIGLLRPNFGTALEVVGGSGNTIGGSPSAANQIAFNRGGVSVVETPLFPAIKNVIRANRIWANDDFDLNLGSDGSDNDDADIGFPPDLDSGANNLQNPPHIASVSLAQGETTITGNIDALAGPYTLDFYSNAFCRSNLFGPARSGEFYLGSAALAATGTAQNPRTVFSYTLPVTAQGRGFTATATDASGNTSEFSACFTAAVSGGANLNLRGLGHAPEYDNPGDAIRFSFELSNLGPFAASNVPVVVSVPAGFLSAWTPVPANFDLATGTWTVPSLAAGATARLDLDATVLSDAIGAFDVEAKAEIGLNELDSDLSNNTDSLPGFVRAGADLEISQVSPRSAQEDDVVSFDVTVTNTGPNDASGVMVSGELDEGLRFESASVSSPSFSIGVLSQRWTWAAGDLANGATATVRVNARVRNPIFFAPDYGLQHTVSAFAATPRDPVLELSTAVVGFGANADLAASPLVTSGGGTVVVIPTGFSIVSAGPEAIPRFVVRISDCGGSAGVGEVRLMPSADFVRNPSSRATCPMAPENRIVCPLRCELSASLASGDRLEVDIESYDSGGGMKVSVEPDPSFVFYDPEPSNNEGTFGSIGLTNVFKCGLLGVESPILIGLLVLLRGRKGRAGFRRMFPGYALVLVLLLGGSAQSVRAAPLTFAIDSAASSASVQLTSALGSPASVAVTLSGSVDADVTLGSDPLFGLIANSLQLAGGAVALSNASIVLSNVPLYDVTFSGSGIIASAAGPLASGFPVATGLSLFDLVGSSLSFTLGAIDVMGTYFGAPVNQTLDLSGSVFRTTLPPNSVAQLEVVDLGGSVAGLRLSLPFSATLQLMIDTEPATVTIAGSAVLSAQSVPEPATALLLGTVGGLGLAVRRQRERRSRRIGVLRLPPA